MHSTENARRGQRRRPDLNINTSSALPDRGRDVIPRTPPAQKQPPVSSSKAYSADRTSRGGAYQNTRELEESFLDGITPVDMSNKENSRPSDSRQPNPRDSHDLSYSPRNVTRDSLVTNMLLSLDQFSMGQTDNHFGSRSTYDENPLFARIGVDAGPRTMSSVSRPPRTNGHSYSYSSDYEGADDASRTSSQPSRGRRSNSSSGFQSNLGRINSLRQATPQRSQPGTPRIMHSRGGRGSKSSSTSNSIDAGYVQVTGSQRWAYGLNGRSSSFDYGHRQPIANSHTPWHIDFSNRFFNDEYDAAPTPTIPGGPRRHPPLSPPLEPPPPPRSPMSVRSPVGSPAKIPTSEQQKRGTRSSRSATAGRQNQPAPNDIQDIPPMPGLDLDSAPAPHVGYEKSKEAVHGGGPTTVSQTREKPGFFRRVFGSSRNNSAGPADSSANPNSNPPQVLSPPPESTERPNNNKTQHVTSQMKSTSTPPSRDSSHQSGHVLQKKPSSFFRRRKKSVCEPAAQPPLPQQSAPTPAVPPITLPVPKEKKTPQPSPATSLRRAMDPYLKSVAATSPGLPTNLQSPLNESTLASPIPQVLTPKEERQDAVERHVRGFSPDYEPSPKATIRSVEREASRQDLRAPREEAREANTPSRRPALPQDGSTNTSFLDLHEGSDNDADSPKEEASKGKGKSQANDNRQSSVSKSKLVSASTWPAGEVAKRASKKDLRVSTIASSDTDEDGRNPQLTLPIEGAVSRQSGSTETIYQSAKSLPSVRVDSGETSPKVLGTLESIKPLDEPEFVVGEPTEDDRIKAKRIFDGNEDFIQKEKAAAWMGEEGVIRQRTLQAYMDLYDFKDKSIATALREVCGRLVLRAETQQVDRILVAFSSRWCDCNPNHGFKAIDIIHTICYSIMLLNTDLHLADIEQKMTRSQFVKNTMTTIRQALQESASDVFERPTVLPGKGDALKGSSEGTPVEQARSGFRNSFKPPPRIDSSNSAVSGPVDTCGPLVKTPFDGSLKAWEEQIETVLKEIYASIRDDRLPLFGAAEPAPVQQHQSQSTLSVMGMLKRSPSVLSKAPSEGQASSRGRIAESGRSSNSRWHSKSRSRQRGFGGNGLSSSRTSFDDGDSIWSPAGSSATWSRYSLGRTQTSMSMNSFGSAWQSREYQQSIGFANALSQAIIRDDALASTPSLLSEELKSASLLEDETLELSGPPWVKEGMVVHKHHLDGVDKKAKDRNWTEVFAVVQKGQISLFSFSTSKSMRNKGRRQNQNVAPGAVVGGGNWQDNATNLGTFSLKQTLASALPPPGYSRTRPHVWALSLPTGSVHLFQVGTPDICKEFVTTANYWSARLSTHPLVGGISNIEYGWSDAIVNNSLVTAINEQTGSGVAPSRPESSVGHHAARASIHSRGSLRSGHSMDQGMSGLRGNSAGGGGAGTGGASSRLPGDRIHIAEWTPPQQSMRASALGERAQLENLEGYVQGIEAELQEHNVLRSPMLLAFTPRGANATKAMANWEKKSAYLLREIVKFRTYVDCLQQAETRKAEIYRERETARRAVQGEDLSDGEDEEGEEDVDVGVDVDVDDAEGDITIRA